MQQLHWGPQSKTHGASTLNTRCELGCSVSGPHAGAHRNVSIWKLNKGHNNKNTKSETTPAACRGIAYPASLKIPLPCLAKLLQHKNVSLSSSKIFPAWLRSNAENKYAAVLSKPILPATVMNLMLAEAGRMKLGYETYRHRWHPASFGAAEGLLPRNIQIAISVQSAKCYFNTCGTRLRLNTILNAGSQLESVSSVHCGWEKRGCKSEKISLRRVRLFIATKCYAKCPCESL